MKLSKKKVSLKTDKSETKSSEEENVKIEADTDEQAANVDEKIVEDISIEEIIENQDKQIQELKDQLLRSLAEAENLRKRTIKEISDAKKYSHISFVRDLVSSVDNLQRALEVVPEDKSQLSEPIKNLIIGLEIVEKEIINTFDKHSLKLINPLGDKFDYNLHQAMFEVPTNEKEPGYVVEVSQKGYLLHDRLVRPAMVGISKKSEEESIEQNNKNKSEEK
jgi:molecular chaperone GrpE